MNVINLGINGFGRIGRNVLRAIAVQGELGKTFVIRAINDLTEPRVLAHLLQHDSIQGKFDGKISFDGDSLTVNDQKIKILKQRVEPKDLPWREHEVEYVLESTGLWTDRAKAEGHLKGGARRVLISAPAKNADATLVMGVNDDRFDPKKHTIISNASCTTNCLAPMVKVLHDAFGIESGFMSTIHSYTNDQRLLDLEHKDLRRARAAAINIIPASTGAAKAIGEVIPELKGKLNGGAFRVPTPNGSVTDFVAQLCRSATVEQINAAFADAASGKGKSASLAGYLTYSTDELVLSDIVGDPHSCIFDSKLTMTIGTLVHVVGWYDNEWGYSNRCVDLLKLIAK